MTFVSLTFDDGTVNQYYLLRALHKSNIRATVFCTTSIDTHPDYCKRLICAEPRKILELHNMGHEIGSHTCTHPKLGLITSKELKRELADSKSILESIIGDEVLGFAYPYSFYDDRTLREVRNQYFYARCGTSGIDPLNTNNRDRYKISSIGVKRLIAVSSTSVFFRLLNEAFVVIMIHDIPLSLLFGLVSYLKVFLAPQFLTMKEVSIKIEKRCRNN